MTSCSRRRPSAGLEIVGECHQPVLGRRPLSPSRAALAAIIDLQACFLNGGFPINFDGRVNCIPPHYIQPTPTMMCAAAVQAASSSAPGLIDLDPDFSAWLDREFRVELGDEAALV